MAIVTTDNKHYTDIAEAIRTKNGSSTTYKPSEMAAAIKAIESSSGEIAKTTAIDYSNYASGVFVETLDTGEELEYTLTLDSEGKPISIATPSGDTVTVEWW